MDIYTRAELENPQTSGFAISFNVFGSGKHLRVYFADDIVVSVHFPCLLCRDVQNHLSLHAPHLSLSLSLSLWLVFCD